MQTTSRNKSAWTTARVYQPHSALKAFLRALRFAFSAAAA